MPLFAFATVTPVVLILLAAYWGGPFAWIAVAYMTVLVFLLDRLIVRNIKNADPNSEFPAANLLLFTLGSAHFLLLFVTVYTVAGDGDLGLVSRVLIAVAAGLVFGQISHPVAHELIHKSSRFARLLGRLIYSSMLVGHHASAHLRVHHVHVASDQDPNSARRGTGFYRFAIRACVGSFRAGLRAENRLRRQKVRPVWTHPYALYVLGGVGALLVSWGVAGRAGVIVYAGVSIYAQMQILMSDYVQHYGLRRAMSSSGALEPVGPQHSWNAPHWFSAALMLNAPRHSDHHIVPSRPYPALQLDASGMPMLPFPLPVMATIALFPPIWRRMMDPRCEAWQT